MQQLGGILLSGRRSAPQGGDLQDVLLAMLVTSIFIMVFVVSSIVHENAYALLAVIVLSGLVVVRVVYYAVRHLPGPARHTVPGAPDAQAAASSRGHQVALCSPHRLHCHSCYCWTATQSQLAAVAVLQWAALAGLPSWPAGCSRERVRQPQI